MIDKAPHDPQRYRLARRFTGSARQAFGHLLAQLWRGDRARILLPAYIGHSPLEGSGVYDPITTAGVPHAFYRLHEDLSVDLDDLRRRLDEGPAFAVLAIHYFGAPQPALHELRGLAHDHGAALVEDCAHVPPASLGAGPAGDVGDYSLFSIHKLIATTGGGILQINGAPRASAPVPHDLAIAADDLAQFRDTAWARVVQARLENYRLLAGHVAEVPGVDLFWPRLPDGTVPLNLPVLIRHADRFEVYKRLRAAGVGAVALYHTLIAPITRDAFPVSHAISARILNLPTHQDVDAGELAGVAERLRVAMVD